VLGNEDERMTQGANPQGKLMLDGLSSGSLAPTRLIGNAVDA